MPSETKPKFGRFTSAQKLLAHRMKEYGVKPPSYQPIGSKCLVWRLPPLEVTSGGLIIPDTNQDVINRGLLLACGPKAHDYLSSNGIVPGHIVTFAYYAGDEHFDLDAKARERTGDKLLTIGAPDIHGSVDLKADLETGKVRFIESEYGRMLERPKALPPMESKKAKVLRLAEKTKGTPEGETAASIAQRMR